MSEGTPSILNVIAPGKTGLSEKEWINVVEILGRRVRSEMDRVSLPNLSDFLLEANNLHDAEKFLRDDDPAPNRFFLIKQGFYFSSTVRINPNRWCVWGVCREDNLWSLIVFTWAGDYQRLFMEVKCCPTPSQILEEMQKLDGVKFTYLSMCKHLERFFDYVHD
ncbi:MAG: hypothetical protein Q7R72_02900, partial [bacterium]|nr:hypothetical protein [bacterium]